MSSRRQVRRKRRSARKRRPTARVQERRFRRAEQVLERHWQRLMARRGVTGVDVGYRTRRGRPTNEVAIRVHVEAKLPPDELHPRQEFDPFLEGIPVDVLERSYTASAAPRYLALQGGVLIGLPDSAGWGTLGMVVYTPAAKQPRLLTNAHIVLPSPTSPPADQSVAQPPRGAVLPDPKARVVGNVLTSTVTLNPWVDCALVEPVDGVPFRDGVRGLFDRASGFGELKSSDVRKKVRVKKMGAATKVTEGIVDSVSLIFDRPDRRFRRQIGVRSASGDAFSAPGDSGAVVVRNDLVVGLLHSVDQSGRVGVACPILKVVEALGICPNGDA